MPDMYAPTSGVLDQYRNTLLPIYEEMCGDGGSYNEIAEGFDAFVNTPSRSLLMTLTSPASPTAKTFLANFFIEFLQDEGHCGRGSFLSWANQMMIMAAHPASSPQNAYKGWEMMNKQYLTEIEGLATTLSRIPDPAHATDNLKKSLLILARRASILSAKMEQLLAHWTKTSPVDPLDGRLLAVESQTLREYFHDNVEQMIMNMPSTTMKIRRPQINALFASRLLQTLWLSVSSPLHWINGLYAHNINQANLGINISSHGSIPEIEFENPHLVRMLLNKIMEAAAHARARTLGVTTRPLSLDFSWNESLGAITVQSFDLPSILKDSTWDEVKRILEELGVASDIHFTPDEQTADTLYIPLKFTTDPSTSSPDGEDTPTAAFNTGGVLGAAPVIDGFSYADEISYRPVWQSAAIVPSNSYTLGSYFFCGGIFSASTMTPYLPSFSPAMSVY